MQSSGGGAAKSDPLRGRKSNRVCLFQLETAHYLPAGGFFCIRKRGTDAISGLLFRLLSPSAPPFCSLPAFLLFLPVLFSWALGGGGVRVWTLNIFVSVKDVKLRRGMIHSFSASPRPSAISTCLKDATKTQVFPLGSLLFLYKRLVFFWIRTSLLPSKTKIDCNEAPSSWRATFLEP